MSARIATISFLCALRLFNFSEHFFCLFQSNVEGLLLKNHNSFNYMLLTLSNYNQFQIRMASILTENRDISCLA